VPYLLLSATRPPKKNIFHPSSFFDLGHVEILLWEPPARPESFGFYVRPGTAWRIFLSVFFRQSARMVVGEHFVSRRTDWRAWPIGDHEYKIVRAYLRGVVAGCANGGIQYRALRVNCFHIAHQCLVLSGNDPGRLRRQWVFVLPTLGSRSFRAGPLKGAAFSSMEEDLAGREDIIDHSAS